MKVHEIKYGIIALVAVVLCNGAIAQSFQEPTPYGGMRGVKMLFEKELIFPAEALEAGLKGNVNLKFIINADGSMRDMQVWQPLDPACDKEAMRLGQMIRWNPALIGGLPRAAEHYLRVPFDPRKYAKTVKARGGELVPPKDDQDLTLFQATVLDSLPNPMILGGLKGLSAYLGSEMRYPSEALKRNIQGTVLLEFVVEATGNVTNVEAIETLGGGCNGEAERLITGLRWRPGYKDSLPVRSIMQVRMDFRLRASR